MPPLPDPQGIVEETMSDEAAEYEEQESPDPYAVPDLDIPSYEETSTHAYDLSPEDEADQKRVYEQGLRERHEREMEKYHRAMEDYLHHKPNTWPSKYFEGEE
jgi:hypothetical protein